MQLLEAYKNREKLIHVRDAIIKIVDGETSVRIYFMAIILYIFDRYMVTLKQIYFNIIIIVTFYDFSFLLLHLIGITDLSLTFIGCQSFFFL